MRDIRTLLVVLKEEYQNEFVPSGLCYTIKKIDSVFTRAEKELLLVYLDSNAPFTFNIIMHLFSKKMGVFWWESGERKPRLKWLDQHIKKNTK